MRPSRKALRVLTLLTLACGAALLVLGIHVSLVARLHASAAALASVGFFVVVLSLVGFVGAGRDKSGLLMGYLFANFVLLTALFVASYAALAFQDSLVAWLKHNWTSPVLAYLRSKECCRDGFEATTQFVRRQFVLLGVLGLACLVLVLLAMYCVVRIVTVPIVMKSLLTVLNAVFCLLGAVLVIFAVAVQSKHEQATSGHQWIAIIFFVAGTLLVALAGLGIVGARAKSRSLLLLYIVGIGACLTALLVCAVAAFTFSDQLTHDTETIACAVDLPGCTNCTDTSISVCTGVTQDQQSNKWYACESNTNKTNTSNTCEKPGWTLLVPSPEDQGSNRNDIAACGRCPEWSRADVHAFLTSGLQLLGLVAAIVCFFILVGFGAALILRRSLAGYQTDSI